MEYITGSGSTNNKGTVMDEYDGRNLQELINARNNMQNIVSADIYSTPQNENENRGFLTLFIALMASMYARIRN
jgi:hypothetical protein